MIKSLWDLAQSIKFLQISSLSTFAHRGNISFYWRQIYESGIHRKYNLMSSRRSNLGPINRKLKRSSVERFPGIAPAPAAYRSPLRSTGPIISEGTAIRPSVIGISPGLSPELGTGYKRSAVRQATVVQAIQTPPVYEVTQTPEVIQAITTPPHVYEIVQPIV